MKIWKIIVLLLLLLVIISSIAAVVEINYCHILTTTPPPNSPLDYTKTGTLCKVNAQIAIPGIAIILLFKAIF